MLGLGQLARLRGQTHLAEPLLAEARARLEQHQRLALAARAAIEQGRLALTRGELDHATQLANEAHTLAAKGLQATKEPGPTTAIALLREAIALSLGQLEIARTQAQVAIDSAPGEYDVLPQVEAVLGQAETALRAENLEAAVASYNRVQQLAEASELADEQALSSLGLARVLLRRGLLQEAINAHMEDLPRLRITEDTAALALANLGLAEAYRLHGDLDPARDALAEAHSLYVEMGDILGEAEATQSESRLLLDHGDLEAAGLRSTHALDLVERVGDGLKDAAARPGFFDGYAAFYCEGILVAARAQQVETANQLASRFKMLSTKVGRAAAAQRLSEYEQAITVRGADLSKEDIERNRATAALLSGARKTLSR
jgi:hypothetical protein